MTIEELKQEIEQNTGIPADLLTGETAEENITQAKALLAYKRKNTIETPKTTAEQFSEWLSAKRGDPVQDNRITALDGIAEAARREAGGYPYVKDGGEIDTSRLPDPRPTKQQFEEWFYNVSAWRP